MRTVKWSDRNKSGSSNGKSIVSELKSRIARLEMQLATQDSRAEEKLLRANYVLEKAEVKKKEFEQFKTKLLKEYNDKLEKAKGVARRSGSRKDATIKSLRKVVKNLESEVERLSGVLKDAKIESVEMIWED